MGQKGLVAPHESSRDRRARELTITDAGRRTLRGVTPAVDALLLAVREATVNAAKHANADLVSVYIEVEPNTITAFVRDKGVGFSLLDVGDDRRGIAMSIRDRIERVGGRAVLDSGHGAGTEWELVVPR